MQFPAVMLLLFFGVNLCNCKVVHEKAKHHSKSSMIDASVAHDVAKASMDGERHKDYHKRSVTAIHPKKATKAIAPKEAKKVKKATHSRRRLAVAALAQTDHAPQQQDILDPKSVKDAVNAIHPKKAKKAKEAKKVKKSTHSRRRWAVASLAQADQAPPQQKILDPKSVNDAGNAIHPKKAKRVKGAKKVKKATHSRRRLAVAALAQVDQAPKQDILDPKSVKDAGLDRDGYKEDWVKEWRHNPNAKPKPKPTPHPLHHNGVKAAHYTTALLGVSVMNALLISWAF